MNRTKQYMSKFNKNAAPFTAADYERAKLGITDYLATNFLAKDEQEMTQLIQALGYGEGDSLIIGREATASASFAALYNGLQTHLLDMDDVHSEVRGHPSAVILSALFALTEPTTSGRLFLESYIYGIELMAQLGKLVNPTHYEQGWHNTSTLGGMAAAGALSKLLQLSLDEQCQAMSIAATQAAGLRMSFGTPIKPMHAGFAARNAVDSILLVKAGFPAQTDFLFHPQGFLATLASNVEVASVSDREAPQTWAISEPGLWMKRYPFCSAAIGIADTAEQLYKELQDQKVKDVALIFDHGRDAALIHRRPETGEQGRFSGEYVAWLGLMGRSYEAEAFSKKSLTPDVKQGLSCVTRRYRKIATGQGTELSVTLENGRVLTACVTHPKGSPQNPLTKEEVLAKLVKSNPTINTEDYQKIMKRFTETSMTELLAWIHKGV